MNLKHLSDLEAQTLSGEETPPHEQDDPTVAVPANPSTALRAEEIIEYLKQKGDTQAMASLTIGNAPAGGAPTYSSIVQVLPHTIPLTAQEIKGSHMDVTKSDDEVILMVRGRGSNAQPVGAISTGMGFRLSKKEAQDLAVKLIKMSRQED